jgi:hypothetical protein
MGLVLPHADTPPKIEREDKDGKPFSCTVTYTRDKQEFSRSFDMDQAKSAGLIKGGGAWTAYASNMLFWRAGMFAAREAFPDILAGIYSIEEMSNKTAEEYQQELKNITPKGEGTGALDEIKQLTDSVPEAPEEVAQYDPQMRYDEPQSTEPDPDTIVTAEKDVVEPEAESFSTESAEMKKIKEVVKKAKKTEKAPELF